MDLSNIALKSYNDLQCGDKLVVLKEVSWARPGTVVTYHSTVLGSKYIHVHYKSSVFTDTLDSFARFDDFYLPVSIHDIEPGEELLFYDKSGFPDGGVDHQEMIIVKKLDIDNDLIGFMRDDNNQYRYHNLLTKRFRRPITSIHTSPVSPPVVHGDVVIDKYGQAEWHRPCVLGELVELIDDQTDSDFRRCEMKKGQMFIIREMHYPWNSCWIKVTGLNGEDISTIFHRRYFVPVDSQKSINSQSKINENDRTDNAVKVQGPPVKIRLGEKIRGSAVSCPRRETRIGSCKISYR